MLSRQVRIAAALPVVAVLGLAARFGLPGALGDWAGGIAYTAFVYGLIAVARPRLEPPRIGVAAFAFSAAIELLQLAGVAGALVDVWSPLRLVVGQSFVPADFVAYALGAAIAAAIDLRTASPRQGAPLSGATSPRPAG